MHFLKRDIVLKGRNLYIYIFLIHTYIYNIILFYNYSIFKNIKIKRLKYQ